MTCCFFQNHPLSGSIDPSSPGSQEQELRLSVAGAEALATTSASPGLLPRLRLLFQIRNIQIAGVPRPCIRLLVLIFRLARLLVFACVLIRIWDVQELLRCCAGLLEACVDFMCALFLVEARHEELSPASEPWRFFFLIRKHEREGIQRAVSHLRCISRRSMIPSTSSSNSGSPLA